MFEDIQQQGGCLFDFVFRTILKDYDIYYSVVFSRGRVNSDPKCMFFSKKKKTCFVVRHVVASKVVQITPPDVIAATVVVDCGYRNGPGIVICVDLSH